jgi:hypothetical protein
MFLDRAQEKVDPIGAQQFLGALDLFVEEPYRLRQQFGAGLRSLAV